MGKVVLYISIALNFSVLDQIKQVTDTKELCQQYIGLELKKKGNKFWSLCPVHSENTPSLCLYPDGKLYCYGCHFKGDAFDLIGAVLGLPLSEVLKMAAADYGLVSDYNVDQRREISHKITAERKQRELIERYRQQVEACYIYLVGKYRETRAIEQNVKKLSDLNSNYVVAAFELQPLINGMLDLLSSEDIEAQFEGLQWAGRVGLWKEQA